MIGVDDLLPVITGALGATVSMVTFSADDNTLKLPAASAAATLNECAPSEGGVVMPPPCSAPASPRRHAGRAHAHKRALAACRIKRRVAPRAVGIGGRRAKQRARIIDVHETSRLGGSVQHQAIGIGDAITGNIAVGRVAGDRGATGAAVSTVRHKAVHGALVLPLPSVAVAARLWAPSARAPVVKLQAPVALAVTVPSNVDPS